MPKPCATSPPTNWAATWDVAISDQSVALALAANTEGTRIALVLSDGTVQERDDAGNVLWRVPLGTLDGVGAALGLAVNDGGDVFVAIGGMPDLTTGALNAWSDVGIRLPLVRLGGVDGTIQWVSSLDPRGALQDVALVLDRDGNVWAAETSSQDEGIVPDVITVLEKHDGGGGVQQRQSFSTFTDQPIFIAAAPDGSVVIAGTTHRGISLDTGATFVSPSTSLGSAFLFHYDAAGTFSWGVTLGDAGGATAHGLAVDAQGNVIVTGGFGGIIQLGSTLLASSGNLDGFAAMLGSDGTPTWLSSFGSPDAYEFCGRVAVDGRGVIRTIVRLASLTLGPRSRIRALITRCC